MNADRFIEALGLADTIDGSALALVSVDGRPLTVCRGWSAEAMEIAARRETPLVIVIDDDLQSAPAISNARPWPVVAIAGSPWAVRAADLGLLVGARGPADHDGLDELEAAALTRQFLELCVEGEPREPSLDSSLLDLVPYPIAESYEIEPVLEALVDGGAWLEMDAGSTQEAQEVLTVVARIGGRSVGIAASRPSVDEGRLGPVGCSRISRLVGWCSRGRHPLVSLVDTVGVKAALDVDELEAVSSAAAVMRNSDVVKIAIVTGRAIGLGATVMAAVGARADMVLPWPRAHFSLAAHGSGAGSDEAQALSAVGRAARSGDVMDVIHPDETRATITEMFDLLRGGPEYSQ
jgi:hypothetical protein